MRPFINTHDSIRSLVTGCTFLLLSAGLFGCGPAAEEPTAAGEEASASSESAMLPAHEFNPATSESNPIQSFSDVQTGDAL